MRKLKPLAALTMDCSLVEMRSELDRDTCGLGLFSFEDGWVNQFTNAYSPRGEPVDIIDWKYNKPTSPNYLEVVGELQQKLEVEMDEEDQGKEDGEMTL
jgi:hypothetical protein